MRVKTNKDGPGSKEVFKKFENGFYKNIEVIETKHPNIVKSVIVGKKGWGLWIKMWSEGIREGSFTRQEILHEFESRNVEIPETFLKEFYNLIYK